MDLKLKGKRALVTGGSKGIGWASACALADEGCEVMIAARNAPAASRFRFRATDLSQRGATEALAEWAGDLDVLVNNAGAIHGGDLLRVDEDRKNTLMPARRIGNRPQVSTCSRANASPSPHHP